MIWDNEIMGGAVGCGKDMFVEMDNDLCSAMEKIEKKRVGTEKTMFKNGLAMKTFSQ